ncbi:MAG: bifunctional (p)ppGpp synthetase/guanosine-3',5'-bis(diphosphate) 3'-pyrophosphohydrolase [Bacteroidales bacterium]|jgi:GTP pyrophosphokinase|nr:bifunctional (p)ppGpp synthetase/guanosine-3',5'-bis(diphosphate) 3'-pyrophosphohydrolase [Bacteroidales bacterium]OQC46166.1 MAG: GTP pyrophosphokinase [Bacteroidetes bacterium ADurb.Bin028]HOD88452.1 RelA/SpoT family protein [Bacteroidales bacterium]
MGLTKEEEIWIESQFDELIKVSKRLRSQDDIDLVRKAFDLANEAHSKMRRKSGEPYFTHPIAVAMIVASEIGLGVKSIVSALLHDVVEDTDYTLNDIETLFGPSIAGIVGGLTKIANILDKDASLQVENFRRMILTMSQDIRVIFIKLADRLHNMRTLDSMPEYKQIKIASETTYLYAPLAHRLGLYSIKTELEDLALKYEHPLIYWEISKKFTETEEERNKYIEQIKLPIQKVLEEENIKANIIGRTKSIYSIWNKMRTKNVPFEEIYDLFAIRIIFDHPDDYPDSKARAKCYHIMALVTNIYPHLEDRVRDWIAKPKANGYEALHVTVMGPNGDWIEVQIRSRKMNDIAEKGLASHWKYKANNKDALGNLDNLINTLQQTLENNVNDTLSFLDDVKMNIFTKEVYVFTPKGEIKKIPSGATVIDFAYEIHTEVGNKAIAAKVNHQLKPLSHVLKSGDQVEILTSDKQSPKREWLNFAITTKAKNRIKSSLKEDRRYHIDKGQEIFIKKVRELNLKLDHKRFKELRKTYNTPHKEDFYFKIGSGLIQIDDLEKQAAKTFKTFASYWKLSIPKFRTSQPKSKKNTLIIDDNADTKRITLAKCCNPIPGDEVAGFVNPNESIIIHKRICERLTNLAATQGDRIISVKWTSYKLQSFKAKIQIEGMDKLGMLNKITKVISLDSRVNIKTLSFNTDDEIFSGEIILYVHNLQDLEDIMKDLLKIDGVEKVTRLEE